MTFRHIAKAGNDNYNIGHILLLPFFLFFWSLFPSVQFTQVTMLIEGTYVTMLQEEPLVGKIYDTSRLKQLCTLTNRSILNMTRDIGYYCLRIVFYILISVSAGFLLFNIGTSNEAILTRGKCDGFIVGLMIFLCLGGVPFYHEELKVLKAFNIAHISILVL